MKLLYPSLILHKPAKHKENRIPSLNEKSVQQNFSTDLRSISFGNDWSAYSTYEPFAPQKLKLRVGPYRIQNLQDTVSFLEKCVNRATSKINYQGLFGSDISKLDQYKRPITDEFLALWKVAEKLSRIESPSQTEKDAYILSLFILLNSEAQEEAPDGTFLFKAHTSPHTPTSIRINLFSEQAEDFQTKRKALEVIDDILCSEDLIFPNPKIPRYKGLLATLPSAEQLVSTFQKYQERFKKLEAIGIDQRKERLAEEARKAREEENLRQEALRKQKIYEDKSGITGIETLAKKRKADTAKLNQEITFEYKINNPKTALDFLEVKVEQKTRGSASFGYLKDRGQILDKPYYDESVALWQTMTDMLAQTRWTPQEEETIDLGLFILNNVERFDRNRYYEEPRLLDLRNIYDILSLLSAQDQATLKRSSFKLSYPTKVEWSELINKFNNRIQDYQKEVQYQEKVLENIRWKNSPAGQVTAARSRYEDERAQQEYDSWKDYWERERARKDFDDAWRI